MNPVITGSVVGAERVVVDLSTERPAQARASVQREVRSLGLLLEQRVKLEKLQGQVLHRRTGRLARSINTRYAEPGPSTFTSSTGTKLSYGRIWELTGTRAYVIEPKTKQALFWKGADHPVRRVYHPAVGKKPFLRPALDEMRGLIRSRLQRAATAPSV